jgi:hypothetical protein
MPRRFDGPWRRSAQADGSPKLRDRLVCNGRIADGLRPTTLQQPQLAQPSPASASFSPAVVHPSPRKGFGDGEVSDDPRAA